MRITPLDVRKQEFRKGMRGLDPEEVYAFLATVADEYETVLTDNRQLRDRVLELDEKVSEYRNMEKTLRDTLLTAERVMAEARENARKEAELILRDARGQAQHESQNSVARAEALRAQLRELRTQRDAFLARLKGLAEAQIGLVESFASDFQEDDRRLSHLQTSTNEPRNEAPDFDEAPHNSAPQTPRSEALEAKNEMQSELEAPGEAQPSYSSSDQWRDYQAGPPSAGPGESAEASQDVEEHVARTVAEMAQAAGAESGQETQSMPPSPDSGAELSASFDAESAEEEPLSAASAEEPEEQQGSRWSISRFTRSLSEF
ncbi:MAG TPA: DivIVA domain-containing protein [Candidatus Krumholzibacteria bacterium]|nr:DivIVA domain-containing protein [Candidatus Krumholzibacteria bacterium]